MNKLSTNKYLTIKFNPGFSLQDLKHVWSERSNSSYTEIETLDNPSGSLWRSIKTGELKIWVDNGEGIISNLFKNGMLIISDYIRVDKMSRREYLKLSLEYSNGCANKIKQIFKSFNKSENSNDISLLKIQNNLQLIQQEIELSNEIVPIEEYAKYIQDLITLIKDNQKHLIDIKSASFLLNIESLREYLDIKHIIENATWQSQSLALAKIEETSLYKHAYNSFQEFCLNLKLNYLKSIKLTKVGKMLKYFDERKVGNIPKLQTHAIALAVLPIEAQIPTWDLVTSGTYGKKILTSHIALAYDSYVLGRTLLPINEEIDGHYIIQQANEYSEKALMLPTKYKDCNAIAFLNSIKSADPDKITEIDAHCVEVIAKTITRLIKNLRVNN